MDGDRDFRFSPRPNRAAEIRWRPWGEPAFAEARRLGRPVLLSLSAVWCHWCHVMDETSYSDPRVIAAVNEHFVPIRVDNDRHPDVNRRYNMGGWPTTAFLAASGDVLTGGTYLPPDQMLESLARVKAFFDANQAKILALAGERASDGDGAAMARLTGQPLDRELALEALEGDPDVPGDISAEVALQVVRGFDPLCGGLGAEPKFPQPDVFGFMLAYGLLRGAGDPEHVPEGGSALLRPARVHEVVRATLTAMASGGLYDGVEGGFFRYATQRDWSVPHYEKMLEDNARLAWLYLEASLHAAEHDLGDPELYRRAGEGTVDYLLATLWRDDVPAFGGSQDADETYYAAGRRRPGGPAGALRRSDRLRGLERAGGAGPPPGGVGARAAGAGRPRPAAARPPVREGAPRRRHGALRARGRRGRRRRAAAGRPGGRGRGAARRVRGHRRAALAAPRGRASCAGRASTSARPTAAWSTAWPCPARAPACSRSRCRRIDENAAVAEVLLRLEAYTGEPRLREQALEILAGWATFYEQYGVAAAAYGQALLRYLERPDQIVVVGRRGEDEARRLHAAALTAPRAAAHRPVARPRRPPRRRAPARSRPPRRAGRGGLRLPRPHLLAVPALSRDPRCCGIGSTTQPSTSTEGR